MKKHSKYSILYAVSWCGGVVAGSILKMGWWWLVPALITAVVFTLIEELVPER